MLLSVMKVAFPAELSVSGEKLIQTCMKLCSICRIFAQKVRQVSDLKCRRRKAGIWVQGLSAMGVPYRAPMLETLARFQGKLLAANARMNLTRVGAEACEAVDRNYLDSLAPLAQGLLTDRYLHGIPADSRVHTDGRFLKEKDITPERLAQIRALNDLARQRGQTLAEMALAWLLHHDEVTTVLIGASKTQQILDNIKAVEHTTFTPDELAAIDRISK